jgi:hypothetical protein
MTISIEREALSGHAISHLGVQNYTPLIEGSEMHGVALQGGEVFRVTCSTGVYYISITKSNYRGAKTFDIYLGLNLISLPAEALKKLVDCIYTDYGYRGKMFVRYTTSDLLSLSASYKVSNVESDKYLTADLSAGQDQYDRSLSKATRYNVKNYYKNRIKKDFDADYSIKIFAVTDAGVPDDVMSAYVDFKRAKYGDYYRSELSGREYLRIHGVEWVNVLSILDKIVGIILISARNHKDERPYFFNIAYDQTYERYSVGNLLIYETIIHLIKNGAKYLDLGPGMSYKQHFSTRETLVYSGIIRPFRLPWLHRRSTKLP